MTRRISSSRPMTGSSLPCSARLGEVAAELLQRLVLVLGRSGRSRGAGRGPRRAPCASASLRGAGGAQRVAGLRAVGRRARAAGARWRRTRRLSSRISSLGRAQDAARARSTGRRPRRRRSSVGSASSAALTSRADGAGVGAELAQHRDDDAAVLLEQHGEQVLGRHLRVAPALGELAGRGDGLLGLDGESVSLHEEISVG